MHRKHEKTLKEALDIALLKKNVMHHVATDKSATQHAYLIIAAVAAIGALGKFIFGIKVPFMGVMRPSLLSSLGGAIMQIIGAVIGIYVVSFIAKSIFKGSASHESFFRVAGFGMILGALQLISPLSMLISLILFVWAIVLSFVILKTIHKLTTGGVIGTFIVSSMVIIVIFSILSPVYAMLGLGGMMGGSFEMKNDNGFMNFYKDKIEVSIPGKEGGTVEFDENTMKITTDDGETVEINIPNIE